MTTEEKASKLAAVLADPNDKLLTYANIKDLLLQMAEWKDQQFKEYLEKKQSELDGTRNKSNYELINEIINELFGE